MNTPKHDYVILEKELHQQLWHKQFGKRAHAKFFFMCVNHLQLCKDPHCCIRQMLDGFVYSWQMLDGFVYSWKEGEYPFPQVTSYVQRVELKEKNEKCQ